ncbi:hypothetical protein LEP1GSC202_1723 [Leptospira yanagawae serovar Saopaulo str. Sao Paulo = ATCC 700523]|uniref:Uncharacterized protein n=1 Tax=Leptospira yanagawae serovar Saopaulo str. Sao Paulo = ATCC 700523 TaxID=1249483 RepID=A0A5E8HEY4_9LEPT|nr:hypothetical protein LEP1GSC202_1723 [Leptospira yanagawae serovar Saopaulo str. Sao Paulo = ATCC 700523]
MKCLEKTNLSIGTENGGRSHLQFPIEHELKNKLQYNQLHRPIFRDKCSVK